MKYWKIFVWIAIILTGIGVGISKVASVSNTVNGKELPIYSVQTEEKKVALSFDAAWGNVKYGLFIRLPSSVLDY